LASPTALCVNNRLREANLAEEELEKATEAEDKRVALLIAVLALFLALSEAGAKNAEHRSTEQNIEASDLFNFYQARKIRQTVVETAAQQLEATAASVQDENTKALLGKQITDWKSISAHFEKDDKRPEDSLDAIQERAKVAQEKRERANRRLEHFEYASSALQISIVLASASIITGVVTLAWLGIALGAIGAIIMALGYLAPTFLSFLG
jgi:TRAP-type uncharacterized transport system fused permease subunit